MSTLRVFHYFYLITLILYFDFITNFTLSRTYSCTHTCYLNINNYILMGKSFLFLVLVFFAAHSLFVEELLDRDM